MNIRSTAFKDNISLSNHKIAKKVNEMDENNFDKILQLHTQITTLLTMIPNKKGCQQKYYNFDSFKNSNLFKIN